MPCAVKCSIQISKCGNTLLLDIHFLTSAYSWLQLSKLWISIKNFYWPTVRQPLGVVSHQRTRDTLILCPLIYPPQKLLALGTRWLFITSVIWSINRLSCFTTLPVFLYFCDYTLLFHNIFLRLQKSRYLTLLVTFALGWNITSRYYYFRDTYSHTPID